MTAVTAVDEFAPLPFLVDAQLAIEKRRVATQVRHSHLKLNGREDPDTDWLLQELNGLEERIDERVRRHDRQSSRLPLV